jgi:hypothetical protein
VSETESPLELRLQICCPLRVVGVLHELRGSGRALHVAADPALPIALEGDGDILIDGAHEPSESVPFESILGPVVVDPSHEAPGGIILEVDRSA